MLSSYTHAFLWTSSDLLGDTNHTTSRACTSIASLLALIVASLSEIVGTGVNDNGTANDAAWSNELDELVVGRAFRVALSISLEVAKIAYVTVAVLWCAMLLAVWVDCR